MGQASHATLWFGNAKDLIGTQPWGQIHKEIFKVLS